MDSSPNFFKLIVGRRSGFFGLLFISGFFSAVFLFFLPVHAQTTDETFASAAEETPLEVVAEVATEAGQNIPPPEVLLDEAFEIEDLGASRANILPDSPWHFFKRVGWGLQEAFTFDPIKDAALKHEHANQQLAEVKQLFEDKGIDGVSPAVVEGAMRRFENKIVDVFDTAGKLKEEKINNPAAVDEFLNEVADKQFKRQKLIDNLDRDLINNKKAAQIASAGDGVEFDSAAGERVLSAIQESGEATLNKMTAVLAAVEDNPADVSNRLVAVLDAQTGSEFRDIKSLEFLEAVKRQAPANVKDAIEQAKKDTITRFEEKIKSIPAAVRGQKFEDYVQHITASETRLFKLLEDIKQNSNLPSDILSKLEQAKEIVVGRFEEKMNLIDNPDLQARLVRNFDPNAVADLVMLDEFRQRMKPDSKERKIIEAEHQAGLEAFKNKFTDAKSQEQAKLFEKLSKELVTNPTAKTFKLLRELEQGVLSDPTKRAFLEKMENNMKNSVEERFRRDGERYTDRFVSLDPSDMAVFDSVDFEDSFKESLYTKGADKLKQYIGEIENPEEFDRFYDRFSKTPEIVINKIREYDQEFQGAVQFKVRKIEEARAERNRQINIATLDYEEREIGFQMDRLQRQKEEEFWNKLNQIPGENFAERRVLWQEKINTQINLAEERYNEQKRIFGERLKNDPWCDEVCREVQLQFIEQQLRHEKQRLADDLGRERNRIEAEKAQLNKNNPLLGKCSTPQECEQFCQNNSDLPECGWAARQAEFVDCGPPPAYWDAGLRKCRNPQNQAEQCEPGFYWDFKVNECVADPYYRPPKTLRRCSWGENWNESRGVCERATTDCQPTAGPNGALIYPPECAVLANQDRFCSAGFFWDAGRQDCVSSAQTQCPTNFYFDYYTKRCEAEREIVCAPGTYWDEGRKQCVREYVECSAFFAEIPCPTGQFREHYQDEQGCWAPGECRQEKFVCPKAPLACPSGEYRQTFVGQGGCTEYGPCENKQVVCPAFDILSCPEGYKRDFYYTKDGCQTPGECHLIEAPKPVGFCGDGRCEGAETKYSCAKDCGAPNLCGNNICDNGETSISCPADCKQPAGYCGDAKCDSNETKTSCPADCGKTDTCATGQTACDYKACPNGCNWDANGCVTGCWERGAETCGNGYCGPGETQASCPSDCGSDVWKYCDGICGNGESPTQCPGDCAESSISCGSNTCVSGSYCADAGKGLCCKNGQTACADGRCVNSATECKIGYCGDGQCLGIETPAVCPSDCGTVAGDCPINFANNYDRSKNCNKTNCPNGCQYNAEKCPTECLSAGVIEYCGNGKCGSGEAYSTCPLDCKTASCGDGVCASNETTTSCPSDCKAITPPPITTGVCGDGTCASGETSASCPADCGGYSGNTNTTCANMTGWHYDSTTNTCVRDGVTCGSPTACSSCPSGSGAGTGGTYCQYNNDGCPTGCQTSTYSMGWCGDYVCNNGETSSSCPGDCGGGSGGYTSETCGNGYCGPGETQASCPGDCSSGGSATGGWCGDYACNNGETLTSCPSDCGTGAGGGSSCGSNPASCASMEACTAVNFFWCNGACYSSQCPTTSLLPGNNRVVWSQLSSTYRAYKYMASSFKRLLIDITKAMIGF